MNKLSFDGSQLPELPFHEVIDSYTLIAPSIYDVRLVSPPIEVVMYMGPLLMDTILSHKLYKLLHVRYCGYHSIMLDRKLMKLELVKRRQNYIFYRREQGYPIQKFNVRLINANSKMRANTAIYFAIRKFLKLSFNTTYFVINNKIYSFNQNRISGDEAIKLVSLTMLFNDYSEDEIIRMSFGIDKTNRLERIEYFRREFSKINETYALDEKYYYYLQEIIAMLYRL